jgi:hypothetical protein
MSALEKLTHAALAAPPQRREAALSVLRGQTRDGDPTEWPSVAEPYLTLRETARRLRLSAATLRGDGFRATAGAGGGDTGSPKSRPTSEAGPSSGGRGAASAQ